MLNRLLNPSKRHNFFLFGARQTGKTTLLRELFKKDSTKYYNLLSGADYTRLAANPELLRQEVLALDSRIKHVFLDEIQRIPALLNEVHALINDNVAQKFILTGSSARKLKRDQANLLAGRALNYRLFPLTIFELEGQFDLSQALRFGTLPHVYLAESEDEKSSFLRSYLEVYLQQEIEAEALSRNIGGFIRFLSIAAQTNTEVCNFANIARDVHLSPVTVKEYFKIMEDTLIGQFLLPFDRSERKRHKTSPKFYFFDTGVVRAAEQRLRMEITPSSFEFGKYFESWIINEVLRINKYYEKDWKLSFLRTANDVEVDLIIETPKGEILGVEIKSKSAPHKEDFASGFKALLNLIPKARCLCVCTGEAARKVENVMVLSYQAFLDELVNLK